MFPGFEYEGHLEISLDLTISGTLVHMLSRSWFVCSIAAHIHHVSYYSIQNQRNAHVIPNTCKNQFVNCLAVKPLRQHFFPVRCRVWDEFDYWRLHHVVISTWVIISTTRQWILVARTRSEFGTKRTTYLTNILPSRSTEALQFPMTHFLAVKALTRKSRSLEQCGFKSNRIRALSYLNQLKIIKFVNPIENFQLTRCWISGFSLSLCLRLPACKMC